MKRIRGFAALVCAMLLAALLPGAALLSGAALAAGGGAIRLGAGGIAKGDTVYFGRYGEEEVRWIALNEAGFLLSQYTLGSVRFRDCRYYYQAPGPQNPGYYGEDWDNAVDDSQLKRAMDGLYNGAGTTLFTLAEQGAVAATVLSGESMDWDGNVRPLTVRLFPLSYMEIYDYRARKYVIDEALLVTGDITDKLNGNEYGWWTRTNDSWTGVVRAGGRDAAGLLQDEIREPLAVRGVRPAFNIQGEAVLFASAVLGGKSAAGMDAGLTVLPAAAPTEWKLTLKDSARGGFSVTTMDLTDASALIRYTGAKTGANEYISAMIVKNESVFYYGRVKRLQNAADASGTLLISLPASVTLDADTQLKVFNEQFNGDRTSNALTDASRAYSDYASALQTVIAPVRYQITQGQAGVWAQGSGGELRFAANADQGRLVGVSVDGAALSGAQYTPESGSAAVTLNAAYLATLSAGQHTLRIYFTDGYAQTAFTIDAAPPVLPPTGDASQPLLWLGIALVAGALLAANAALFRRKGKTES